MTGEKPKYSEEKVFHCFFDVTGLTRTGLACTLVSALRSRRLTARATMGHKGGRMFICFARTCTFAIISFVDYSQRLVATSCNQVKVSARLPVGKVPSVKCLDDPTFDSQQGQQICSSPKSSDRLWGPRSLLFITRAWYRAAGQTFCPPKHIQYGGDALTTLLHMISCQARVKIYLLSSVCVMCSMRGLTFRHRASSI